MNLTFELDHLELRAVLGALKTMLYNLDPNRQTDAYDALASGHNKILAVYESAATRQIH